jgi:hypothetical protein
MYKACIKRIDDGERKSLDDRLWYAYIHSGKEMTFDDYKKEIIKPDSNYSNTYSDEEKELRSNDIIAKTKNLENKMHEIENRKKVNIIVNEVIL